ncbi:hypothetical protein D3C87_1496000 [compost metagenome]
MNQHIDVNIAFTAPTGIPGVVRLQHEGATSTTALLSMERAGNLGGPPGSASLTTADMRRLVDGLMDAVNAIERQSRLSGGS